MLHSQQNIRRKKEHRVSFSGTNAFVQALAEVAWRCAAYNNQHSRGLLISHFRAQGCDQTAGASSPQRPSSNAMTSTQPNSTPSSGPAAESGRPAHRDWIPPIPRPLQRLFDATPLVTYPPNELPYRSPAPNDLPTLHVFITEAGAARDLPSFNPSCLKWQVGCFPDLLFAGPGSGSGAPTPYHTPYQTRRPPPVLRTLLRGLGLPLSVLST